MLEGEVYAVKTGLAILIYFEKEFMKMSYFKIIKQLRNIQQGKIQESRFFKIINEIKINE